MISDKTGVRAFEVIDGFLHIETVSARGYVSLIVPGCDYRYSLPWAPRCWRQDLPSIRVDVDVVSVLASVRDKRGGLVSNLEKSDFTILEDGKPQEIKYFTRETDLPLTIGLLVDVSGSQRNLIDIERNAASQFFSQVLA